MIKPVGRTKGVAAGQPAGAPKAPASLKDLKAKTMKFMDRKGADLLGAGKPHDISDRPPQKSAKRVATAAGPTLFAPGGKRKAPR